MLACLLLAPLAGSPAAAAPLAAQQADLGTSFTYQGRLTDTAGPVNATCDFQFRLFDSAGTGTPPTGGTRIGPPLQLPLAVADGLFTATLDFGAGAFDGQARWLDIAVRCPSGAGTWIQLSPRQPLTAAPYALYAPQAGSAGTVPWSGLTGVPAGLSDGDTDTTYTAGFGLGLTGTTFRVVTSTVQGRVTGTCPAGSSIRAIAADGSVTCETDTSTTYSAGTGLVVSGTEISLQSTYRLPQGCANTQVAEWSNGAWVCGTDDVGGGGGAWSLTGNSSTTPANFLGTTDNVTLTLAVSSTTAYRLVPTSLTPNLIGGSVSNFVSPGVVGATIAGGGQADNSNIVSDDYGFVGGGRGNVAGDDDINTLNGRWAVVAGGAFNVSDGAWAAIGGGIFNNASGTWSHVGGGVDNVASGQAATVPGGSTNTAAGDASLAAGYNARANHDGAFVWGDFTEAAVASSAEGQFVARANGGFFLVNTTAAYSPTIDANVFLSTTTGAHLTAGGAWTNSSDRNAKAGLLPVDGRSVLEKVAELPISTWSYRAEDPAIRHLGPTAQDFQAAFGLGADATHISTIDADGVSLAAIQGLYALTQEQQSELEALEARLAALEQQPGTASAQPHPGLGIWAFFGGLGGFVLGWTVKQARRRPEPRL
jgi:hypothetical protein